MLHNHQTNKPDGFEQIQSQNSNRKAYFVGGGIASLAGVAFLIRDSFFSGDNIHVFEGLKVAGGSLDGAGSADSGYVIRGGRMLEEHYVCTYDLFASIPALTDSTKIVKDEIFEFSHKYVSESRCRLVRDGKKVDVSSFELSEKDRLDLLALIIHSEDSLGAKRIKDWFSPEFFEHNFWLMWATMFAFQPSVYPVLCRTSPVNLCPELKEIDLRSYPLVRRILPLSGSFVKSPMMWFLPLNTQSDRHS